MTNLSQEVNLNAEDVGRLDEPFLKKKRSNPMMVVRNVGYYVICLDGG